MFDLFANKTELTVRYREPTTSGSVGIYKVRFQFSREWDGLEKIACFRSGSQVISVLLDETEECAVPHEVTDPDDKGKHLYAGVYGTNGGATDHRALSHREDEGAHPIQAITGPERGLSRRATAMNYGWTGSTWDPLGQIFEVEAITNAEIDTIVNA